MREGSLAGTSPLIAAQKEIRPHERLVWADHPVRANAWRQALPRALFGVAFGGFALVWMAIAFGITRNGGAADGDPVGRWFPFFGLPLFAVGAGMVVAAVLGQLRKRSTVYALTDARVLVISDRPDYRVRTVDLDVIDATERVERKDGSGDLVLIHRGASGFARETLTGVPEVARVAMEVEKLRSAAEQAAARAKPGDA